MAITIINNQPIRFRNADDITEDCNCLGQQFTQKVNNTDQTQFQIKSSNGVSNGTFDVSLDGWDLFEAIVVTSIITNESETSECDGEIEVSATGGTGPYTYSINGGSYGASTTFTGLCAGFYVISVKDANDNTGSLGVYIATNIDCSLYAGSETDDLLPLTTAQLLNCLTSDFI